MNTANPKPVRPWQEQLASLAPYIAGSVILIILPPLVPSFLRDLIIKVFIFAIFAMSLNLLAGYTGLFAFGHAAFFGAAGYTTAVLVVKFGIENFWITGPAGILMATLISLVAGLMVLRVTGIYFIVATLAVGQIMYGIVWGWKYLMFYKKGLFGIGYPTFGIPWLTLDGKNFYYFTFLALTICFLLLRQLINSPLGLALQGIRENEPRMRSLGYNTWLYKYIAFTIAGLFAGVAGVLYAYFTGFVVPQYLGPSYTVDAFLMVIIGGSGTLLGPIIGAAVIIFVKFFASLITPEHWPLIQGAIFVIAVLFLRGGIYTGLINLWRKARSWKR